MYIYRLIAVFLCGVFLLIAVVLLVHLSFCMWFEASRIFKVIPCYSLVTCSYCVSVTSVGCNLK